MRKDMYILIAAALSFVWGVLVESGVFAWPEFWDEETLQAFFMSLPCLMILSFVAKDALDKNADTKGVSVLV